MSLINYITNGHFCVLKVGQHVEPLGPVPELGPLAAGLKWLPGCLSSRPHPDAQPHGHRVQVYLQVRGALVWACTLLPGCSFNFFVHSSLLMAQVVELDYFVSLCGATFGPLSQERGLKGAVLPPSFYGLWGYIAIKLNKVRMASRHRYMISNKLSSALSLNLLF